MDLSLILTIVFSTLGLLVSLAGLNFAIFSWFRSDTKAFERKIDASMDEFKRESRDFHGRMCSLEERYWSLRDLLDKKDKKEEEK